MEDMEDMEGDDGDDNDEADEEDIDLLSLLQGLSAEDASIILQGRDSSVTTRITETQVVRCLRREGIMRPKGTRLFRKRKTEAVGPVAKKQRSKK